MVRPIVGNCVITKEKLELSAAGHPVLQEVEVIRDEYLQASTCPSLPP